MHILSNFKRLSWLVFSLTSKIIAEYIKDKDFNSTSLLVKHEEAGDHGRKSAGIRWINIDLIG